MQSAFLGSPHLAINVKNHNSGKNEGIAWANSVKNLENLGLTRIDSRNRFGQERL
jgi:hypothetical protein